MTKITRVALAVINGLAQFGAQVRAYLLSLHINALTALVNKADAAHEAAGVAVDDSLGRLYAARARADEVAAAAQAEAQKHGVTLEV